MADPNTRQGKRTPVTLKIKFKSETLEQFIERYAVDVSQGGIFIRTKEPLQVGTQMKFEFQLRDASPLIAGEGTVVWTRENDPSRPAIAPGMGVRFDRLAEGSQSVLEKILAEKAKQAPQRGGETTTKPPMFTDTPTRVAPAPVQDALLGTKSGRTRADSEQTPLPKPMPFHSDADEFGAEAFEEATKVRALDELVAQTAEADPKTAIMPPDELAARRRAETPLAEPPLPDDRMKTVPDRDSAPGLPSPPEPSGRTGRLLDTTPSPRPTGTTTPPIQPGSLPPASDLSAKTRLGLEPAKASTMPPRNVEATERVSVPRAVAAEPSHPVAPPRPSSAPIVIGILVVVAAAMAAVWYFVLRDNVAEEVAQKKTPTPGSNTGSATGSNAAIAVGSGSAGSAEVKPAGPTVETEIASNIAKATVSVVDSDQTGPAPFKAKLEKDRMYKVRVAAPGYLDVELDVKGGQDKVTAKLVAKPHVLSLATEPPGAQIFIDNAPTGKVTPFELELTAAQAAKPKIHVQLRKAGFRPVDQMVDMATGWSDEEARVVEKIDSRLAVMVMINTNNGGGHTTTTTTTTTNAGSGAGSASSGTGNGSASTGTGNGSATGGHEGSASTGGGAGSASSSGGGAGSASAGTSSGGTKSGSGEPEPDWSKKSN